MRKPNPKQPNRELELDAHAELVKFDYEQSLGVIDGIVRVSTNIRALAVTVWVGLLAASIQTGEAGLAVIGVGATVIFALLDAYHGWLYANASERVYGMERLLYDYYKYQHRRGEQRFETDLAKSFRGHQFGQLSHMPELDRKRFYARAKPRFFYRVLYPGLAIVAALVAIFTAIETGTEGAGQTTTTTQEQAAGESPGAKTESPASDQTSPLSRP